MTDQYHVLSGDDQLTDFHQWDSEKLGLFFRKRGLGDYCKLLNAHKITGKLAPLLTDNDLKEIGISVVGDRLMFKHHLNEIARKDRFHKRIEALWEGGERVFFNDYEQFMFTCGGFCPVDPSSYKLTRNHIKVKKKKPFRCGPIRLVCCGSSFVSHNIDLSKVDDVDVIGIPAPCLQRTCCCSRGKDIVEIESRFEHGATKISLTLPGGQGDRVASLILNQVEESQQQTMERC